MLVETKSAICEDICRLLGIEGISLSNGSTVPRQLVSEIAVRLRVSDFGSAIEVSQRIVATAGISWSESADSSNSPSGGGGTITVYGLNALREAIIARLDLGKDSGILATQTEFSIDPTAWTHFIGQTVSRSLLWIRFGVPKIGEIVLSSLSEDVFIFIESGDHRLSGLNAESRAGQIRIDFHSLAELEDYEGISALNLLATHSRMQRRIRLFEGASGATKYLGEYSVSYFESWVTSKNSDVETFDVSLLLLPAENGWLQDYGGNQSPDKSQTPDSWQNYENIDELALRESDSQPFDVDPSVIEQGRREHIRIQNLLADWIRRVQLLPLRSTNEDLQFDLAWRRGKQFFIAEVKSCTDENQIKQFRLGLGQVLDYAEEYGGQPVLVIGTEPKSSRLVAVASRVGVILLWPDLISRTNPWEI